MKSNEIQVRNDQRRLRREVLLRRIAHTLRGTVRLLPISPETNVDDVRVELTDDSLRVLAPLVEAVDILEEIIWASDGCMGHKDCVHSMEPWERARALLMGKWQADVDPFRRWPEIGEQR